MKMTRMSEWRVRDLQNVALGLAKHFLARVERPTDAEIEALLAVQFDFQRTRADK